MKARGKRVSAAAAADAPRLAGRRILLGITGGIAAYRCLELVRLVVRAGGQVRCILTSNATQFVTPLSVEALSGNRCATDPFARRDDAAIEHIEMGVWADTVVVAPATANFLAKMACGIADDLLSTTLLALPASTPVVIAPAMNTRMWQHPATQRNLATLRRDLGDRLAVAEPQSRVLACGEEGVGAMAEPSTVFDLLLELAHT
jgi:phosphopantothenoylcysteine decarboxylase/phosphopantothenate--cysteine ligase